MANGTRTARRTAAAIALAALTGCAGVRRAEWPFAEVARDGPPPLPSRAIVAARPDGEPLGPEAERVRAQVATRMRSQPGDVHRRLARAIVAESRRARLDPLLVLAVIHVESSFDPHAESSAGAVGLMQLQEPTMRGEVAASRLASANRRDPVANVRAGVRYLRRLLDSFGTLDDALMAYNAGPGKLRGFLARGRVPASVREYPARVNGELARLRRRGERNAAAVAADELAERPVVAAAR